MASTTHDMAPAISGKPDGRATIPSPLHVVCLSPQPWRIDLPTNRQQIMARVAREGHRVLFVETGEFIGRHIAERLRGGHHRSIFRHLLSGETVEGGIHVMRAPTVAPWGHRYGFAAWLNAVLTAWVVRWKLRGSADAVVLWLYDPCFAACIGRAGEQFAVYDCVDDYAEQAGEDRRKQALLSDYDARAAAQSRLVFTTAAGLTDRHRKSNGKTYYVPNVGDFAHFSQPANGSLAPSTSALAGPVIGFAGNFLANKVNFALLEEVATRRPEWTVLLIGPARDDTASALQRLVALENVRWLGQIPYERLPHYVARFDVATIPYLRNAYTRSCFPLKTFEYLAAGKPVVACGLPELEGMEPHVVVAEGVDEFLVAIEDALASRAEPQVEARRRLAAANTWETRTRRLLELVGAELE